MELLSIIVPCFNEEATVESFYARTSAVWSIFSWTTAPGTRPFPC